MRDEEEQGDQKGDIISVRHWKHQAFPIDISVVYVCICTCVYRCVHPCTHRQREEDIECLIFIVTSSEIGSLPGLGIHFPLAPDAGVPGVCNHIQLLCGHTQVCTLAHRAFLPTEPSSQPRLWFLLITE